MRQGLHVVPVKYRFGFEDKESFEEFERSWLEWFSGIGASRVFSNHYLRFLRHRANDFGRATAYILTLYDFCYQEDKGRLLAILNPRPGRSSLRVDHVWCPDCYKKCGAHGVVTCTACYGACLHASIPRFDFPSSADGIEQVKLQLLHAILGSVKLCKYVENGPRGKPIHHLYVCSVDGVSDELCACDEFYADSGVRSYGRSPSDKSPKVPLGAAYAPTRNPRLCDVHSVLGCGICDVLLDSANDSVRAQLAPHVFGGRAYTTAYAPGTGPDLELMRAERAMQHQRMDAVMWPVLYRHSDDDPVVLPYDHSLF